MHKISRPLMKLMIEELSGKQINHVLLTISYQDKYGFIPGGIFYKDVWTAQISIKQHYLCLKDISEKNIYVLGDNGTIYIPLNTEKVCLEMGYITLPNFIFSAKFLNLPVTAKKLILKLLSTNARWEFFKIGIEKLMEWTGLNRPQKVREIISLIHKCGWFNIVNETIKGMKGKNRDAIAIMLKRESSGTSYYKINKSSQNIITRIFRKKKINATPKVLKDFIQLLHQYRNDFFLALDFLEQSTARGEIFRRIITNQKIQIRYS